MSRPAHLDPALVLLVAAGGTVGTAARYSLSTGMGDAAGWPVATLVENLLGAFLLGALLEALVRRGEETRRGRALRLAVGTGMLGGFTTFSALALEVERLLAAGDVAVAVTYGTGSVLLGVPAALLGVVVAARHHSWRRARLPRHPGQAERLGAPEDAERLGAPEDAERLRAPEQDGSDR